MTTKTIDCVDCGASVPYGRLSCPACGSLLASVAGAQAAPGVTAGSGPEPVGQAFVAATAALPERPNPAAETWTGWPPVEDAEPVLTTPWTAPYRVAQADTPRPLAGPVSLYRPPSTARSSTAAEPPSPSPASGAADQARFVEIAGWFVIVGSTMSALGFLLPWSRVVIGARSLGGYFDAWGLASSTHILVLLTTLAVLALGIVQTPVPTWLRSGVLGLGLGSLLIGLTWPYLVGPLGADVGVIVVALGGLALVVGGAVASWATRHQETQSPV